MRCICIYGVHNRSKSIKFSKNKKFLTKSRPNGYRFCKTNWIFHIHRYNLRKLKANMLAGFWQSFVFWSFHNSENFFFVWNRPDYFMKIMKIDLKSIIYKVDISRMRRVSFLKLCSFDVLMGTTYTQSLSFRTFVVEEICVARFLTFCLIWRGIACFLKIL